MNDRGYCPLSMGYCTFYSFPTKLENWYDHVGSFPDVGHGPPHLGSPLSRRRAVSPTFWISLVLVKSTISPIQTQNCRSHSLKVADHQIQDLFRGKMLTDKVNPLKSLRSCLFLTVLYLLNRINFKFDYLEYELKYRLYKIKGKLTEKS